MATKKASKAKAAKRKTTAGKKSEKLACRDCGLVLTVDERCGCADLSEVMCCGAPMKQG